MDSEHLPFPPELLDPIIAGLQPPPIPWLVRGLFPSGTLLEIAADPKTGKSFLALDLALAVIEGTSFLGLPVECQGPVAYFDEENSLPVLRERVFALTQGRGIKATDGRLHFYRFRCVGKELRQWVPAVAKITKELKPVLIIFDTLLKFSGGPMPGKENDSSLMQAVCGGMRQVARGQTALFLHHLSRLHRMPRGSTILVGDPDGVWKLTRVGGRPRKGQPLPPLMLTPTESRLIDVTEPMKVTARGTKECMTLEGEVCAPPREDEDGSE